jgi:hypothetical protein
MQNKVVFNAYPCRAVSAIHQNLDVLGSLAENAGFSFVKVQFSLVFRSYALQPTASRW